MTTHSTSLTVQLRALETDALVALDRSDPPALEEWRIRYLGRKGLLARLMESIGSSPPEERAEAGREANRVKKTLEDAFRSRADAATRDNMDKRLSGEMIDVTLPGRRPSVGYAHPVQETIDEIIRIFADMGFSVLEGPEVEWEHFNFELLNIPLDHPARDTMDTFYVDRADGVVLRTHTSPAQARTMLRQEPPVRVIVPGLCYRRDAEDASHLASFYQCEGLAVDRDVTFADLKGTLAEFARRIFGARTRFRPHHFQFTEPSAEVDFSCTVCGGKGCRTCKYEGWLEVLGCGMVHPQVLRNVGYDPRIYAGFAFGMGPERIATLRYGVPDLRLYYSNSPRFLEQFR